MKKFILFLCGIALCANQAFASQCFIVKEKEQVVCQEGDCNKRYAPCSTFKIALSLIGYDARILFNEMHPLWSFQNGYLDFLESWKKDQTPKSWMKNSCVWYSQVLLSSSGRKSLDPIFKASTMGIWIYQEIKVQVTV